MLHGEIEVGDALSASGRGQKVSRCPKRRTLAWRNVARSGDAAATVAHEAAPAAATRACRAIRREQRRVLGVAADVVERLRADRNHRQAAHADIVEHAADDLRPVAPVFVPRQNLGVLDEDRVLAHRVVVDEGDLLAGNEQPVASRRAIVHEVCAAHGADPPRRSSAQIEVKRGPKEPRQRIRLSRRWCSSRHRRAALRGRS